MWSQFGIDSALCMGNGAIAMGCGTRIISAATDAPIFAPNASGGWGPPGNSTPP